MRQGAEGGGSVLVYVRGVRLAAGPWKETLDDWSDEKNTAPSHGGPREGAAFASWGAQDGVQGLGRVPGHIRPASI